MNPTHAGPIGRVVLMGEPKELKSRIYRSS